MGIEGKLYLDEGYVGLRTVSSSEVIAVGEEWEVTMTVLQSRTLDGENWEEKHSTIQARDAILDVAVAEVSTSMLAFLESVGGDLFSMEEEIDTGLVM